MKILVNTPDIHSLGGVANHYLGLKPYWTQNVKYHSLGSKRWRTILTPLTILKFIVRLMVFRPDVVLLNPSLGYRALIRDFWYLNIGKFFGRKVVLFIHGFNWEYAKSADWYWIAKNLNKADGVIVLARAFSDELKRHHITTPIFLSTTKVMDTLIEGVDLEKLRTGKVKNLLFLSRIERGKGIYEAVDTFALLKEKYKDLTFTFVGDGTELVALKQYVEKKNVKDVRFTGALCGEDLKNEYKKANFFFFFTSYGEGMPTAVLEAMAFGLPVITRTVGGLCDFFEDEKMGRITDSMNPLDYARMVEPFIKDSAWTREVSLYNHHYAKEHFMASKVAHDIENILANIL